jgi:4-hydroxybenzoate polyprenyltransferase and related prenyltransferases
MRCQGYFSIMRPMNAIVAGLAAVIGYFIATSAIIPAIVLLVVIVFLVTAGGNVINDYYDSEIDAINRPGRPIPSGEVKKETAFHMAAALFIAGVFISFFTNPLCAGIAIFNSAVLVLYASHLKKPLCWEILQYRIFQRRYFSLAGRYRGQTDCSGSSLLP